eukprot:g10338.t1
MMIAAEELRLMDAKELSAYSMATPEIEDIQERIQTLQSGNARFTVSGGTSAHFLTEIFDIRVKEDGTRDPELAQRLKDVGSVRNYKGQYKLQLVRPGALPKAKFDEIKDKKDKDLEEEVKAEVDVIWNRDAGPADNLCVSPELVGGNVCNAVCGDLRSPLSTKFASSKERRSLALLLSAYKVPKASRNSPHLTQSGDEPLLVKGASYSHGLDGLRAVFSAGTNLSAPVPKSRWDHEQYYDPDGRSGIYAKHAACIGLPQPIDAAFFGLEEEEASHMDPMQRSCLLEGFAAVRSAKMTRKGLLNSCCGVYVGSMNFDHAMSEAGLYDRGNVAMLSSRISHVLGLRGPSLFMDTGCSSSLVAADLAANHLRRGRASLTLALGVNHLLSPLMFHGRCAINLLSRVGHSAPFNATADGYVVGEGCGAIVLGRSGTPMAIYRGSHVMEDGRSAQLTAPSGPAQQELLRETWRRCRIASSELVASECQANGSLLGDPIEMGAIEKVHGPRPDPFILMSGKCNKGHGEGVAGITTLLKILFLQERQQVLQGETQSQLVLRARMCEPAYVSLPPGLTQINHPQDTPWKVAVDPATVSTVPGEDVSESSLSHLTNWQPTEGSQGHPELCHRPCLFFARGSCQSGAECRYCHLDHSDRPAGLDKSQRQAGPGEAEELSAATNRLRSCLSAKSLSMWL